MSIGCFIGVRASYGDHARDRADSFLHAIKDALAEHGLETYEEPVVLPDVYGVQRGYNTFGRSFLDHDGTGAIVQIGRRAEQRGRAPNLTRLAKNPFRVAYLPVDLPHPLQTNHVERLLERDVLLWVGSAAALRAELLDLAPELGIPLENGDVGDATIDRINDMEPLFEGDPLHPDAETERGTWLLLFEGARLACKHDVALALAG